MLVSHVCGGFRYCGDGLSLGVGREYEDIEIIVVCCCFFFFQAEDGIRDYKVTGVQTCALPIYGLCTVRQWRWKSSISMPGLRFTMQTSLMTGSSRCAGPGITTSSSSVRIQTRPSRSRSLRSSGETCAWYSGSATMATKSSIDSNHWMATPSKLPPRL